jgi:hypothetical protein
MEDLASRLANRVQLTTDGHRAYPEAVERAFGSEIDYSMLVKLYESTQEETRYSPAVCVSCESKRTMGNPAPKHVSTSFVERQQPHAPHEHQKIHETDKRFQPED